MIPKTRGSVHRIMWVTTRTKRARQKQPMPPKQRCVAIFKRDIKLLQYEHSFPGLVPHNQDAISSIVPPCFVLLSGRVDACPQTCLHKRYLPISTAACAYDAFCKRILNSYLHIQHLLSVRSTQPVVPYISQEVANIHIDYPAGQAGC